MNFENYFLGRTRKIGYFMVIHCSFCKKFIDKTLYNNYSVGYLVSLYDILLNNQHQVREKTPIGIWYF